MQPKFLLSLIC